MKKIFFLVLAASFFAACNTNEKSNKASEAAKIATGKLTISGKIIDIDSGSVILYSFVGAAQPNADTLKLEKGSFVYETTLDQPIRMILEIEGEESNGPLTFFADPGQVKIEAVKDSIYNAKVVAGVTQTLFEQYQDSAKKITDIGLKLREQYDAAQATQDVAAMEKVKLAYQKMSADEKQYSAQWALNNSGSVVAPFLALSFLMGNEADNAQFKEIYNKLTPEIKQSVLGKKMSEAIDVTRSTEIGSMAPELKLPDVNGAEVSLSSFKGKYVLVDFWASWCGPCRGENPTVVKAYNEFKSKNFDILGVSLDNEKEAWEKAIKADKLTWTHVSDLKAWDSEAARLYGVHGIPTNFLLDKEGKIIAKDLRGDDLLAKLKELL